MCQLTLINVNDPINRMLLYSQLMTNSRVTHQDGTGFFQKDGAVFKSKNKPAAIENFYNIVLNGVLNFNPIIGHVRLTAFKGKVSDENSHPFESDTLILAHNGTLIPKKDAKLLGAYTTEIDSEIFLKELTAVYDGKNFVKAFNLTMDKFTGPFAFLIYSKLEERYFVIRGKTKTLYLAPVFIDENKVGYVINTEKNDLINSLYDQFINSRFLSTSTLYYNEPILLAENSIYEARQSSIKYLGETKENEPERAVFAASQGYWEKNKHTPPPVDKTPTTSGYEHQDILDFLEKSRLSLEELDIIMFKALGIPLCSATDQDFETFTEFLLPALNSNVTSRKASIWLNILKDGLLGQFETYTRYKIYFPYFINKTSKLEQVHRSILLGKQKEATA